MKNEQAFIQVYLDESLLDSKPRLLAVMTPTSEFHSLNQ